MQLCGVTGASEEVCSASLRRARGDMALATRFVRGAPTHGRPVSPMAGEPPPRLRRAPQPTLDATTGRRRADIGADAAALAMLQEMGFSRHMATTALKLTSGDVGAAANVLASGMMRGHQGTGASREV